MVDRINSIPKAITVICLGNICRSPAGEYLLGYYAKKSDNEIIQNIRFSSAGLMGGGSGGMSYYSKEYLEEKGIDCSKFRSTPIDKEYLDEFDLIIVMEEYMRNEILNEYYKNIKIDRDENRIPNIKTLSETVGKNVDIEDPYGKDRAAYRIILDIINEMSQNLIKIWEKL